MHSQSYSSLNKPGVESFKLRKTHLKFAVKHSYWLKLTSFGYSSSIFRLWTCWLSHSTKYVCHVVRETPKNVTRTSVIYWFCFTEFMREMLHSLSKKVTKCTK